MKRALRMKKDRKLMGRKKAGEKEQKQKRKRFCIYLSLFAI